MLINKSIDIDSTINSGQVFLWKKQNSVWYGVDGESVLSLKEPFEIKSSNEIIRNFLRSDDDFEKILKKISLDKMIKSAINHSRGLRLIRQDPFQCYISFIVSSNSNIQNIKLSLNKLCQKFGKKERFDGSDFFLFPTPKSLANAKESELLSCGLGYRAKAVKIAAKDVESGKIDFDLLKKSDYQDAKEALLQVYGIGNKVADCIMLFSLEKLDAFPLDRWMLRILQKYYSKEFEIQGKTITEKKYNDLHEKIVNHFGEYAGYAQQFLFKMERDLNQKKWL